MLTVYKIPEPFLFNPLKHHLEYIRTFGSVNPGSLSETEQKNIIKELKHLGTSVMDVYTGTKDIEGICKEIETYLIGKGFLERGAFSAWTGREQQNFKIVTISDESQWTVKYHENENRFIHIFPARSSPHSFRVKSNTLKSALLYYILVGKNLITADDLNTVRPLLGLSPVRDSDETEAITEMIEILRCD